MQFQHLPQDGCPRPGRVVPRDQQSLQRRPQAAGVRLQAREREGVRVGEAVQVKRQSRNLDQIFYCVVFAGITLTPQLWSLYPRARPTC